MSEDEIVADGNPWKTTTFKGVTIMEGHLKEMQWGKATRNANKLGFILNNSSYIALKKFADVVNYCLGQDVVGDVETIVYQFEEPYLVTGLTFSNKVHALCRHLVPFIRKYLPKCKGLGIVSEEQQNRLNPDLNIFGKKARNVMKREKSI